jgi:hypothetical protein
MSKLGGFYLWLPPLRPPPADGFYGYPGATRTCKALAFSPESDWLRFLLESSVSLDLFDRAGLFSSAVGSPILSTWQ